MEKVFAVPGAREHKQDKFDMAQLVGSAESKDDPQRSKDYDSDCKFSFEFIIFYSRIFLSRMNFF